MVTSKMEFQVPTPEASLAGRQDFSALLFGVGIPGKGERVYFSGGRHFQNEGQEVGTLDTFQGPPLKLLFLQRG